jgi:hypothetical protein
VRFEITVMSVDREHIRACQNHNACEHYTLRVEITLERVVITLVIVIHTHTC